jgi:hypothetical protein
VDGDLSRGALTGSAIMAVRFTDSISDIGDILFIQPALPFWIVALACENTVFRYAMESLFEDDEVEL